MMLPHQDRKLLVAFTQTLKAGYPNASFNTEVYLRVNREGTAFEYEGVQQAWRAFQDGMSYVNDANAQLTTPFKVSTITLGLVVFHNMPCAIHPDQHAVIETATGVYQPSWQARTEGWRLIQAKTRFQRFLLRFFRT